jgi:hypothetical protein
MNQNVGLGSISYTPNNNNVNSSSGQFLNSSITTTKFGPRALRSETRAKAKDEIKKVKNTIQKVKKWEKRLVVLKDSSLKVYKWIPIASNPLEIDQSCQRDNFRSNMWKKFNISRNNDSLKIQQTCNTTEVNQLNKTIENGNLLKIASLNFSNRSVLNHDENAQDSLTGCDRRFGKINYNQIFSHNNLESINDNNPSSSLTFCTNRLLSRIPNDKLTDLNNNNIHIESSDSESNQNFNDNENNMSQCEAFTQIETINNSKIPSKQNGSSLQANVFKNSSKHYETCLNNAKN